MVSSWSGAICEFRAEVEDVFTIVVGAALELNDSHTKKFSTALVKTCKYWVQRDVS